MAGRTRQLTALLGIVTGLLAVRQGPAELRDDAASLSLSERIESLISADEVHSYTTELMPGDYLLIVDQKGLDLRVSVASTTNTIVDSPSLRDDRETAMMHVVSPSLYTITIDSDEYTGATARYSIEVRPVDDPITIAAERLMTDAAAANERGGKENWQLALVAYQEALVYWRQSGSIAEQARALYNIAFLHYWQFFSWKEAAEAAAAAADLYEADGQTGLAANARHLRAASLIEAANEVGSGPAESGDAAEAIFRTALELFESVAETQEALGQDYDHAHTINNIGLTHYYRDDLVNARLFFARAATEFRRLDEWWGEMIALANLAVIDHEKGRLGGAARTYERLLQLLPADRELAWRADTLDNLGTTRLLLGETDAAMQSFFAAFQLHQRLDDTKGLGRSIAGIGSTYAAIGEIELGRDYLERSLALRREANDGKGQAADLRNLANIHRMLGELDVSLEYHEKALELATSPLVRARVLVQQARDWIDTGEIAKAIAVLEEAWGAAESEGAARILADAALELGRANRLRGDSEQAKRWLHRAHDLYATLGLRSGQAQSLLALARQASDDSLDTSIAYGLEAVDLIEELRSNVADLELRAVYLGGRAEYYDFLISALMRASKTATTQSATVDLVRRALEVSERARARATVDLINEAAIDFTRTVDPEVRERQAELNRRLIESTYRRDSLLEQNASPAAIQEAVAELQAVHTEIDVLEVEARASSSTYSELSEPAVLDSGEMQNMLAADTVVLQYALGDNASYLWIITKDGIRPVALPRRSVIDALARDVYKGLATPMRQAEAARRRQVDISRLSEIVIGPALSELNWYQRVVVAADGALQYVPFTVLLTQGSNTLNKSHDITVIPSMTVVARQQAIRRRQSVPAKTLAVIGDPVFDKSDRRFRANVTSGKTAGHDVMPRDAVVSLSQLPFSGHEVEQIASLVGESERLVATGFEATKALVAGDRLKEYRYIHFATHGIIDSSRPALSTLVLSLLDENGKSADGYFRLRDIYNLELNSDVVVLSACDTALGREIRGEGLIGMTQGFLYAGAAQIVASLWQVPDRATAELMTSFYRRLLEDHQSPMAALRGAQRDLARQVRWRDPYYWSGFVIQGDWRQGAK